MRTGRVFSGFLRAFSAWVLLCPLPALAELRMGVIPYLSTRALMGFYEPARAGLETRLGQPVKLDTAPDYPTFHRRTLAGEYDIVITNPVYGRIAQKDAGLQPVARASTNLTPILIVPLGSKAASAADLVGKTIAITEKTATITQIGQDYLRRKKVDEVKYVVTRSHTNSIAFLERGEADAAISSTTALKQAVPGARANVRVLEEIGSSVPPVWYMLFPAGKVTAQKVRDALLDFAQSEAGRRYIEALGHQGILPVVESDMAALDAYAEELKPQLQ